MTYQVGQLSYSLFPAVATPGELADNTVNRIVSKVAKEAIQPGRGLELAADGSVQQVQQTSSTMKLFGFSVFLSAREGVGNNNDSANPTGAAFAIGDMVPVLRRGSLFAEWKGTTQVEGTVPNMYHSSTTATDRGKVTDAATATTAGSEITVCPSWVAIGSPLPGSGSVVLVHVNAPGAN